MALHWETLKYCESHILHAQLSPVSSGHSALNEQFSNAESAFSLPEQINFIIYNNTDKRDTNCFWKNRHAEKMLKVITFSEHTLILLCVHECVHSICIFNNYTKCYLSKNGKLSL